MKFRFDRVFHPFLFALYPILFLYNYNDGQVTIGQVYRSLAFFLILTALGLVLLRLLLRDWHGAGLVMTLGIVLFFSYGHLYEYLRESALAEAWIGRALNLLAVYGLLFGAFAGLILWKLRGARSLTIIFNAVGLFLVVMIAWTTGFNLVKNSAVVRAALTDQAAPNYLPEAVAIPTAAVTAQAPPDVYYIILDGYAGEGVLRDIYGIDNTPFYDFLRQSGFTVSPGSHANYMQTILSVSSSLNFAYLDQLVVIDKDQYGRNPALWLMYNSRIVQFMRQQNYRIITLQTGFEFTDLPGADLFIKYPYALNSYERQLLSTTVGMLWMNDIRTELYRQEVRTRFSTLPDLALEPGPKFIFAHLVMPHPPFVFDREGKTVLVPNLGMSDGSHNKLPDEEYVRQYGEQLLYVNQMAEGMIRGILENSPTPPVIILQSDHGPGAYLEWESLEDSCVRERMEILNAYLLPGKQVEIAKNITPVNSFRLVLDAYFDTQLGQLENQSYFTTYTRPFDYQNVTGRLDTCAPLER